MLALIDGDIIAYRIGFASQTKDKETGLVTADPKSYAIHSLQLYVNSLIDDIGCTSYKIFLSPSKNYRNKVRDDYKGNRKDTPKPIHLKAIRTYLVAAYKAQVVKGIEADDALGLMQEKDGSTCIATVDKDLLMVEGKHYHLVKKTHTTVTHEDGERFFFQQMLTGDTADNILGIKGIGPVKASKLLEGTKRRDWGSMILDAYIEHFGYEEGRMRCVQNSQLLWILQKGKQMPMDFTYE
tara:strand:- start:968 stop:1684 length:717 start_codon:yes stop_codon:yes gene_type:complete